MTPAAAPAAMSGRSRWAWTWTPGGTLALLAAWAVLHASLRLTLSSALTADDAREAVLAQSLAWGYQDRQPPLYNWLAWGAFQLLGPGLLALTVLKYAILTLGLWLLCLAARRVLADPRHVTLATFSFLLIVPISWTVHEALTHSITVIAACAGTLWALLRLAEAPRLGAYAVLGVAIGLGALSKFTYLVFLMALVLAALTLGPIRARLLDARVALTVGVAAGLVLPYGLWFAGQGHDLLRLYAHEVQIDDADPWVTEARVGLLYVARMAGYYLAPLSVPLAFCFPPIFRRLPAGAAGAEGGRLLGRLLVAVLLLLAGAALVGVLGFLKYRWLIPAFLLVPLYAFWRLERQAGVAPARLRAFALVLLLVEAATAGGLVVRVLGAGLFPHSFRMNEPYDAVADGLVHGGFRRGTILAGFGTLAGNLRVRFPESRVLHVEYPGFRPPATGGGQCLLVWDRGRPSPDGSSPPVPDDLRALAAATGVPLTGQEPARVLTFPFHHDARHTRRVYYILVPEGAGDCR
jgi:hypothetical protein